MIPADWGLQVWRAGDLLAVQMVPSHKSSGNKAGRWLILIGSLVLCMAGLRAAKDFFVPVALAFFVATISVPITHFLVARRFPRSLAVLVTVLVDFCFILGVVFLATSLAEDLQKKWNDRYAAEVSRRVQVESVALADKLESWGVQDARDKINQAVQENLANLQSIRFERVLDVGAGLLGRVIGFFGAFIIVLILTVFMLVEAPMFARRLNAISQARGPDIERLVSATRDIQRFLAIKTVVSLATGVLAGFLCWAAGLDFYILWGILAFALNFIPVIGSIVAGVPPTLLALITTGLPTAVIVAGGYLLINNALGNFLEPLLVGRRFGVSTLVVIMAVMFWGWMWGPLGMLLAVPITMLLKVVLEGSDEFRWIAVAISADHGTDEMTRELARGQPGSPPPAVPSPTGPVLPDGEAAK
jgi:AI-2 transport protein TqsA